MVEFQFIRHKAASSSFPATRWLLAVAVGSTNFAVCTPVTYLFASRWKAVAEHGQSALRFSLDHLVLERWLDVFVGPEEGCRVVVTFVEQRVELRARLPCFGPVWS